MTCLDISALLVWTLEASLLNQKRKICVWAFKPSSMGPFNPPGVGIPPSCSGSAALQTANTNKGKTCVWAFQPSSFGHFNLLVLALTPPVWAKQPSRLQKQEKRKTCVWAFRRSSFGHFNPPGVGIHPSCLGSQSVSQSVSQLVS